MVFVVSVKIGNNPYKTHVLKQYLFDAQPTVQDVLGRLASEDKVRVMEANVKVLLSGAKVMALLEVVPDNGILTICL